MNDITPFVVNAYLGGSFDPVHFGHLTMLQTVNDRLCLAKKNAQILDFSCQFVPTKANPFKQNQTATTHRLAMLALAIQKKSLIINTIEADDPKNQPSYTVDTLTALTLKTPNDCHCWVMGLDSLAGLPTWKNYKKINELANLWVFVRNANTNQLTAILSNLPDNLNTKITFDINDLFAKKSGVIFIDKTPIPTISSTDIRTAFQTNNASFLRQFVPMAVWQYANEQHLYD